MPPGLPKGRKGAKFSEVFSRSANVNWLSAARAVIPVAKRVAAPRWLQTRCVRPSSRKNWAGIKLPRQPLLSLLPSGLLA